MRSPWFVVVVLAVSPLVAQVTWAKSGGRSGHAMAPFGNGLLLTGGLSESQVLLGDTWEMSQTAWTPRSGAGAQLPPLYGHAMTNASNGRVIAFGGSTAVNNPPVRADTWVWTGNNWTLGPVGPSPRIYHAMAYDSARNAVVLFGGSDGAAVLGDTWILDLVNMVWRAVGGVAPLARYGHAMAFDSGRGRVVLTAGASDFSGGGAMIEDHWEWDGTAWTQITRVNALRAWRPGLAYDPIAQRTVLLGGFDRPDRHGGPSSALSTTAIFDGVTWVSNGQWDFPDARGGVGMAFHAGRGRVVIHGGSPSSAGRNARSDTWEWMGTQWAQVTANLSPLERSAHAMCFDSLRQRAALFGGDGPNGELGDTWSWDGRAWLAHGASGPSARSRAAMAFDTARGVGVLFGGEVGLSVVNDTWTWDGSAWTPRSPASRPGARAGHGLAFDSLRNVVVLFGGETTTANLNDTWEWNGTTWTRRSPSRLPTARRDHAMAFDSARRVTVLFGGRDDVANVSRSDTWEWDGNDWTPKGSSTAPLARYRHAMVFDAQRERVVLFGGAGGSGDTWEWDGTRWSLREPATRPTSRAGHAMAFDSIRNKTVLFGGSGTDETWEYTALSAAGLFEPFGPGCSGTEGVPELDARELPWVGERFNVDLRNTPRASPGASLLLGMAGRNIDLTALGMTGCRLSTSSEVLLPMAPITNRAFRLSIDIPRDSGLIGAVLYTQALVVDLAANPAGLILSNARRAVIDIR